VLTVSVTIAASPAIAARLSSSSEIWSMISVSPNSQLASFVVFNGDCGRIHVMNVDGTNEHPLTPSNLCVSQLTHPVFSPNGTKILFNVAPRSKYGQGAVTLAIDTVAVSTGKVSQVVKTPWDASDRSAIWSPDGTRIAYVHLGRDCRACIFLRRLNQSKPLRLVVPKDSGLGNGFQTLAWSPNGSWIAYTTDTELSDRGDNSVYVVHPNGRGKKQLTHGIVVQDDLSWSPNSSTIAYTGGSSSSDFNIRTVNVSGTVHKTIVVSKGHMFNDTVEPVFSPDGKQIAYLHAGLDQWYGDSVLFVASSDGTNAHPVSQTANEDANSAAWVSNDALLFTASDGVYSVSAAGGTITQLVH
jgi:Tol biopolymer transport system component